MEQPRTEMFMRICLLIGAWQIGLFIGDLLVELFLTEKVID